MRPENFVGREAEARALLQNTVQGHASLLIGEAGMGKSALLDYVGEALHDVGTPVFWSASHRLGRSCGNCSPGSGTPD